MVRMKSRIPETRTTYYLKPGQTLKNTKASERALALIVPKNVFQRFTNYTTENQQVALLAEREAKRLAALKEATYNMSKSWEDTAKNIQKRRREELLSRKKLEEADRIKFMKEMAAKNALERAEVVKQAKELILYRKPQCRLINQALLTSECLRELDEQVKFQKTLKDVKKQINEEQVRIVIEDVEKFHQEEKKKREEKLNKIKSNKEQLEKQIEKNRKELNKIEESIKKSELEDLQNMSKEIKEMKEKEIQEALQKKERLKKMFLDAIEEKRQCELKVQQDDEFQDKSIKIYRNFKDEMEKLAKEKTRNAKVEKARKIEMLAKKVAASIEEKHRATKKQEKNKEEIEKEMEEKQRLEELQRIEDRRRKKEKARLEMQEQIKNIEEEQEKRRKEEMDLKVWETLQRYKRDEFNKEWNLQHLEAEKNKRLSYGKILKKQMNEKNVEKEKAKIEADDSIVTKEIINKANEKVLAYGEKVLQESRHVRPIFPIVKTIEQFKKEAGLIPAHKRMENTEAPSKISKRRRAKRIICPKPVDDENAFYFA